MPIVIDRFETVAAPPAPPVAPEARAAAEPALPSARLLEALARARQAEAERHFRLHAD